MKLTLALLVPFSLTALATPLSNPNPFEKRDNWCVVASNGVDCRSKPGVGAGNLVRDIKTSDRFGVACTKKVGGRTWDWVPGWGCWVSARDTRTGDAAHNECESGLHDC
ncbi:hypothetical protein DPSP01_003543 [Paraphaeosphaeria sporulosa]|uniref:Uncharacterized protein n=1 Tax=Paraphaeosphaeria sporulosa TaxID=1460663 RepID=A0A177BVA1_9PLEO|nr:uncharacterized protein CC84DRAFT_1223076 [Paraphaeosphaeria sporulosa]OAF99403.1 hypothetical protein CC84DRAFT_1223076 [Paraphaeosphaeria sporulosa]